MGLIRSIRLINYRGFSDTKVYLRPFTLLIGRNSAGKSTLIESLRLLSLITLRLRRPVMEAPPEWTGLERGLRGVKASLHESEIDLNFIGHEYSDDPSKFVAMFNDKVEITGYLRKGEPLFATIRVGEFTASYSQHLRGLDLPEVFVMPQVTPIARNERLLDAGYVKRNQYNPVSRLHFRNQIHYLSEYFGRFKENAESTWPKLRILEFRREIDELQLLVQEEVFASEAGSMGSGLQVWLQMMWFLSKVSSNSVIALDEPDVYLHADLQRKLVSLLRDHQGQVLVATVSRSCRNAERTRSR